MKNTFLKSLVLTLTIPQLILAQTNKPAAEAPAVTPSANRPIYLEGYVPVEESVTPGEAQVKKVYLLINNGVIEQLSEIAPSTQQIPANAVRLTEKTTGKLLLSPGFIDMHNHIDHAILPLWEGAKGQYNNRFAWRLDPEYKANVRGRITAIKDADKAAKLTGVNSNSCKILQYAEMKALIGGVTTIQGVGGKDNNACVFNLMIRNVENNADFKLNTAELKTEARVAFEVINPKHGLILQEKVYPAMEANPQLPLLNAYAGLPPEIKNDMRYEYTGDFFDGLTKLQSIFNNVIPKGMQTVRAYITHLAEGKSADPFSMTEFKMAQALGFARHGMVMIHGVGLNAQDWEEAAKENISLVWSPFSNLLLYGETTDVQAAAAAKINISFGSDWSPSGSKTLLDEVKIAKRYLIANRLGNLFSDKDFHNMLTINAAKALKLDDRIGEIKQGYLADIVAVPLETTEANPYSTIVNSDSSNIKLVIAGGKIAVAARKWMKGAYKTEPILAKVTPDCAKLQGQVLVNLGFSLKDTMAAMTTALVDKNKPEVTLDGPVSCQDKKYLTAIDHLFESVYQPEAKGQLDPKPVEDFAVLNKQLATILRKPVAEK